MGRVGSAFRSWVGRTSSGTLCLPGWCIRWGRPRGSTSRLAKWRASRRTSCDCFGLYISYIHSLDVLFPTRLLLLDLVLHALHGDPPPHAPPPLEPLLPIILKPTLFPLQSLLPHVEVLLRVPLLLARLVWVRTVPHDRVGLGALSRKVTLHLLLRNAETVRVLLVALPNSSRIYLTTLFHLLSTLKTTSRKSLLVLRGFNLIVSIEIVK